MENNLTNIRFDDPTYQMYVRRITRLLSKRDPALAGLATLIPQSPVIIGDTFFTHYSYFPSIRSTKNPDETLENIRQGMLKYVKSKDYRRVRTLTMLDEDMSLIYTYRLTKEYLEEIRKKIEEEARKQGKDPDKIMSELAGLGAQAGQQGAGTQPQQGGQGSSASNTAVTTGNPLSNLSKEAQEVISNVIKNLKKDAGEMIAKAGKKAGKDVEKLRDVVEVFGGKGKGGGQGGTGAGDQPGRVDHLLDILDMLRSVRGAEKILSLGKKLTESLPRMVKLLRVRGKRGEEIYGYYRTTRLERVIPRELALPDELFFAKLASGGLSAREYANMYEGAYYVLIDKSGSMSGEKTVWARSVALAIHNLAVRKGRKFFLRFFDADVYDLITDPLVSFKAIVSIPSDGGTNIDYAIRSAIKDMRERRVRGTSTIIIITDGRDEVRMKVEELKSVGATLTAVMIRGHNGSLEKLARESGGQYLKAQLTEDGALQLIHMVSG